MLWAWILGGLALTSLAINGWQWAAAWRFPLHPPLPQPGPDPAPGVTILKPLKGADPHTRECLASWLNQEHRGPVQFLFGVADPDDPAAAVVSDLLREHPARDAALVVCSRELGPNGKVNTLAQLEPLARHPVLVVSDADVLVPAGFLPGLIAPLSDPGVGLVHCLYVLAHPTTLPMHWEAVGVNCDFWSQVLQSGTLAPHDFALGAVMALPRAELAGAGGFGSLVHHLADDFQLGRRIVARGRRLALSGQVAECREAPVGWIEAWRHQVRWSRTIRVCRPGPFFLSLLNNVTGLTLLWVAVAPPHPAVWTTAAAALLARLGIAAALHFRIRRRPPSPEALALVWLKDLLGVLLWVAAFTGDTVEWRGTRHRVDRRGRLHPIDPPDAARPAADPQPVADPTPGP